MTEQELIELLADKEHESWAHWMLYLFSKCDTHPEVNGLIIPVELVARWERQSHTPYANLSEREKQSDRDEVSHILPIINKYAEKEQQSCTHEWVRDLTEEEVKSLNNIFYGEERNNRP